VIAVACELPSQRQLPLSRHSASSIHEVVTAEGLAMSLRTVQRILAEDTLKPWRYRSWIHPRDPDFRAKAEVILGLYEGVWKGRRLDPGDLVVCADEKPSIQARHQRSRDGVDASPALSLLLLAAELLEPFLLTLVVGADGLASQVGAQAGGLLLDVVLVERLQAETRLPPVIEDADQLLLVGHAPSSEGVHPIRLGSRSTRPSWSGRFSSASRSDVARFPWSQYLPSAVCQIFGQGFASPQHEGSATSLVSITMLAVSAPRAEVTPRCAGVLDGASSGRTSTPASVSASCGVQLRAPR
jgi:hypothetical protein